MSSEVCLRISPNSSCGFRLTGGVKFGMPLTVFEVLEGSLADEAGIRLGDVLIKINGMDADNISLDEAQKMIVEAGENVTLSISNTDYSEEDEEDLVDPERIKALIAEYSDAPEDTDTEPSHDHLKSETSEVTASAEPATASVDELSVGDRSASADQLSESIDQISASEEQETASVDQLATTDDEASEANNMPITNGAPTLAVKSTEVELEEEEEYVDVRSLPLKPPMPPPIPEKPVRKCWHPVMLDTNPPPIIEESTGDEEYPHKKTMRELRKAIEARKVKATPEPTSKSKVKLSEKENDLEIQPFDTESNAAVAKQLRTMQKQLEKLSALPATIQATLKAVANKIDYLLPAATNDWEELDIEPIVETYSENEECQSVCSSEDKEEDYLIDSFDAITEENEDLTSASEMEDLSRPASQSDSEQLTSTVSDPSSEQLDKIAKMQKLATLNKSWPWADEAKPIYKIADHYEPVYARCISNKVKWLEERVEKERIFAKKLKGI